MTRQRRLRVFLLAVGIAIVCLAGGLFARAVIAARAAAIRMQCSGLLCQIHCALQNYHGVNGCFPPAYIAGPDGKPMHSWRVLILPYLEQEEAYKEYDFSEPWNGPKNRRLATHACARLFQCPAGSQVGSVFTNYVVVVGPNTAFPGARSVSLAQFPDHDLPGARNTIMVVEVASSDIQWLEPRDFGFAQMSLGINSAESTGFSSCHPGGANAGTSNSCGGVWFPETTSGNQLKDLVTLGPQ